MDKRTGTGTEAHMPLLTLQGGIKKHINMVIYKSRRHKYIQKCIW